MRTRLATFFSSLMWWSTSVCRGLVRMPHAAWVSHGYQHGYRLGQKRGLRLTLYNRPRPSPGTMGHGGDVQAEAGNAELQQSSGLEADDDATKHTVVFVRHGQSDFNKYEIFTGWCDVDVNRKGEDECRRAGMLLASHGFEFDLAYTSVLKRATKSLWCLLDGCDHTFIPVRMSWRLNERHYGALQGLSKQESERRLGPIVREWRRAWDAKPPDMDESHPHWPIISRDRRYRDVPDIPCGESLEMCSVRVKRYWDEEIVPTVREGKRVVIVAHANSLRSLIKELDGMSKADIEKLVVPNAVPIIYRFGEDMMVLGEADATGFRGRFLREDDRLARWQEESARGRELLLDGLSEEEAEAEALEAEREAQGVGDKSSVPLRV